MRTRAQSRILEHAVTLPNIPESSSLDKQDDEQASSPQAPPYQLRTNRAPRYRCGSCGSRICSCVILDKRLTPGAVIPTNELLHARNMGHPQHEIFAIQTRQQELPPLVHHVVITVENTYLSDEP